MYVSTLTDPHSFVGAQSGTYQGTPVAIKMLLGNATSALSELAALRLEVSILSRANHPNGALVWPVHSWPCVGLHACSVGALM